MRAIVYLIAWMGISVLIAALLYPIVLMRGGPYTECLSDPYAFTPAASSFECRADPFGVHEMFDGAYRAGWLTIQTGSMIIAGILGLVVGMLPIVGIDALVTKVRRHNPEERTAV